jgi:hypothetical protein
MRLVFFFAFALFHFIGVIVRLDGGDGIAALEPFAEIDVGAALAAERLECIHTGLIADRTRHRLYPAIPMPPSRSFRAISC